MKKLIPLIIIFISNTVFAQYKPERAYRLGYKIGMVSANITGGRAKSGSRLALEGGIWCQIKLNSARLVRLKLFLLKKEPAAFPPNER